MKQQMRPTQRSGRSYLRVNETTSQAMKIKLRPLTLKEANELIGRLHRHHKPVVGHRFTIGAEKDGVLVGAAVTGRPTARMTEQYRTAEVTRLVTDGTPHVCSKLYAASARAAEAMGYDSIQTFILEDEPGTSLKAAGWEFIDWSGGGDWNSPSRGGRRIDQPMVRKQKWGKLLGRKRGESEESNRVSTERPENHDRQ